MLTPAQINILYALGRDAYDMAADMREAHGRQVTTAWDVMDPDLLRETAELAGMTDEEVEALVPYPDEHPGSLVLIGARDYTAFVALCRNVVEAGFQAKSANDKTPAYASTEATKKWESEADARANEAARRSYANDKAGQRY